jgi:hypothetical protein
MRSRRQIGLAGVILLVVALAPSPDGRSVSHPPEVITADTSIFKVTLEDSLPTSPDQPEVYCGVTVC